ncbi:MAG TPA: threonine synthase [Thermoanaerobaculia bacterium]|nr:threonine synthase [Thermoanaerobaculia bacterium]
MILTSTRDSRKRARFGEAMTQNLAPGGGLYIPLALPAFEDVDHLLALAWTERSIEILRRLLGDDYGEHEIAAVARDAFDFPVPLVQVSDTIHALELFHGPSLAFKDFGARFLARMLQLERERQGASGPLTVLTATSGDTGAAVALAFWRVPGVRVVVLYPRGRVSPLQERQFAALGDNVLALAVDGSFDHCQYLAKACFADRELTAELGLTSANSINIARLTAQILYYFEAVSALRRLSVTAAPVIAVPSGNFGNLCAGLYARRMGLPVRVFVAATNVNKTVPEYLESGEYRPRPSIATLSNAMDVGDPSNWERITHLFGRDWQALRAALRWGSLDDDETRAAIRALAAKGYVADPHTAVAWAVLRRRLQRTETGIFLATAHPAKFQEVLEPVLGREIPLPPALAELVDRPLVREAMVAEVEVLKRRLRELAR